MTISTLSSSYGNAQDVPAEDSDRHGSIEPGSEKAANAVERSGIPILEVKNLCHRYPHLDANTLV